MSIGSRLKELRLKKNESLQDVADATGASKPHIWELEAGRRDNPSIDLLRKLADHFGVNIAYLAEGQKDDESEYGALFRNADKMLDDKNKEIAAELIGKLIEMQKKSDGSN
jgi:transcriptional regulator with XRE-family HTH domain